MASTQGPSHQLQQAEAIARLRFLERTRSLTLADFIPYVTPAFEKPSHLGPLTDLFERIKRGDAIRALTSAPPQHGKSETIINGIAQLLRAYPQRTNAYITYEADVALGKSRRIRDVALAAGVELRQDTKAVHEWRTREGGGLIATSIGGPLGNKSVDGLLVLDDPYKNRAVAESRINRDTVYQFFTGVAMTRAQASTSILVQHARWHVEDLIGLLSKQVHPTDPDRMHFEHYNIPAVNLEGEPLWPKIQPMWRLEETRATNEYEWWSLYMGEPRPPDGAVFRDVQFYDELPKKYRVAYGVDLAVTANTHSDYCAAVVLAESGGNYYVLDVKHEQSTVPDFAARLREIRAAYPGAPGLWHTSSTEQGTSDLLRELLGFHLRHERAAVDKFNRAQPVAAAWNARDGKPGRIFLPRDKPWVSAFVSEILSFTGIRDKHDDQVDALASAFVQLSGISVGVPRAFKTSFTPQGGSGPVFPASGGSGFSW